MAAPTPTGQNVEQRDLRAYDILFGLTGQAAA